MRFLVTAGKHINNIHAIARQLKLEELSEALFSVGSTLRLYSEDRRQAEDSLIELCEVKWLVGE
jgi:hypothetical protein